LATLPVSFVQLATFPLDMSRQYLQTYLFPLCQMFSPIGIMANDF
jgi:hypothetical protein